MTKFVNGIRTAVENVPKPAWIHWPGQRSFCCCFTVRTGASAVGWFNFVFNSLYVGMMVLALARTKDNLSQRMKTLTSYEIQSNEAEGSAQIMNDLSTNQKLITMSIAGEVPCFALDDWNSCKCEAKLASAVTVFNTTSRCRYFSQFYPQKSCMCHMGRILFEILPLMYKSLAIPGVMLVVNILWLTSVESKSIQLLRLVGFIFMISIPIQLIVQFYFQVHANRKFIENDLGALHWAVWLVYASYTLLNIYALPLLHIYIKLRTRECSQGIEQGLLTTQRNPPNNQALDGYLEDAFAIDSDAENDRICYTITNNRTVDDSSDTNNLVAFDYNQRYQTDEIEAEISTSSKKNSSLDSDSPPIVK